MLVISTSWKCFILWKLSAFLPQNSFNYLNVVVSKPSTFLIVFGIFNVNHFKHCGKICRLEAMEVGGDPFKDDGDVRCKR